MLPDRHNNKVANNERIFKHAEFFMAFSDEIAISNFFCALAAAQCTTSKMMCEMDEKTGIFL